MGLRPALVLGVLVAAVASPGPLVGVPTIPAPDPGPGESRPGAAGDTVTPAADLLRAARRAQRRFERHRRRRLPRRSLAGSGRCDERVGRYCLFHGDDEGYEPPADPPSVRERRLRLLEILRRASRAAPSSGWAVGQRVRYLVEAGRAEDAVAAAGSCTAGSWWCHALEGYARHRTGRPGAEAAFDRALASMGPARRARWEDLSPLLEGGAAAAWRRTEGPARRRLAERIWWLADPLYLLPGNDRRAEHFARRVQVRFLEDAAGPFGTRPGPGLDRLLLRYGPHVGYARDRPGFARHSVRPRVTGFHDPDALRFLPDPERILRPLAPGTGGWRLTDPRPRTSHAPASVDTVRGLDHRVALFPREGATTVVVRFAASEAGGEETEALLALGHGSRVRTEARSRGGGRGVLAVAVPPRPHLLSVEVLSREGRWAERARLGLPLSRRPEGVPGLSGLLPARAEGAEPPASLAEAMERAVGLAATVAPGDPVDLFWEVYGPSRLLSGMEVTVGITDGRGSWLDRVAGAMGLGGGGRGAGVGWRDGAGRGRVHPRGVRFTVPGDLRPGTYPLQVSVRLPGFDPLTARTEIRVDEGR